MRVGAAGWLRRRGCRGGCMGGGASGALQGRGAVAAVPVYLAQAGPGRDLP